MANHKKPASLVALIKFVAVAVIVFVGANVATYLAFISAFRIAEVHHFLIASIFALLSGGFIATLILEKYFSSMLIRIAYLVTAVWTGTFVYLFFASVLYGISRMIVIDAYVFGVFFFLIAIALGVYGVIHSTKIYIKKIQVSLPNIPESWKGRTAVWVSDLHLGSIYQTRFAKKVTSLVNSLSPDIIFIGGDLYDGTHALDAYALAQPLEHLSSQFGTFFVTGNHEEFGSPESFLDVVAKLRIRILNDEKIDIDGLQIAGVDYLRSAQKENFKRVLESMGIDKSMPSILLKHEPRDLDVAEHAGISLQISGHTHRGQQWPFGYLAERMYKGFAYGLRQHGTMQVCVSSGVGGWGPPVRVDSNCEIVHITFK